VVNVKLQLWPLVNMGEWIESGPEVVFTSCGAVSWLVHVTVEPAGTLRDAGEKAYPFMATE
jgi:hypothetical protein